jgi:Mrp family chromosome partitioning ATPase
MSTLDKAFIKAYQQRGSGAPHIPLTPSPPAPPEATPAPAGVDRAAEDDRSTVEATPSRPSSGIPKILAEAEPAPPASDSPEAAESWLGPSGDLVPAFEVERFDWPQAVTSLLKNSSQLGALVSELLPDGRGTLIVSGCRRGEGRTSVALLVARYLARRGVRVAVVDADIQQPQLASRLGMLVEAGWETGLIGELPPGEALIESLRDRLTLVPLKRPVSESELSDTGRCLNELIKRLQTQFEVLCVDAGPLVEAGETSHQTLFGQTQIDAAIVVRDIRHCRLEQTQAVGRKLAQLGVGRWAVVENFCGLGALPA